MCLNKILRSNFKIFLRLCVSHPFLALFISANADYLGYRFSKIQNLTTGNCLRNLSHQKKWKTVNYYWKKVRLWLNKSSLIRWLKKNYIIIAFSWKISVLTSQLFILHQFLYQQQTPSPTNQQQQQQQQFLWRILTGSPYLTRFLHNMRKSH